MRRKEKEIKNVNLIEKILYNEEIGHLATCVNNTPYVVPVNFTYHEGKIFLHSHREGMKIHNITANPRVCFEVDHGEKREADSPCAYSYIYQSVIVHGRAILRMEPEKKLKILKLLSDKYAHGKSDMLTLEQVEKMKDLIGIEIIVEEMTGKKSPA